MFVRDEHEQQRGGSANSHTRVIVTARPGRFDKLRQRFQHIDLIPDLGSRIGSIEWYRGAATCAGLLALVFLLSPGFERPIYGSVAPPLAGTAFDEARSQSISSLSAGAATGARMGPTALVQPLKDTPERPIVEVNGTLGGGSFQSFLQRSGVGGDEAKKVASMIGNVMPLGDLRHGTRVAMTLGRRETKSDPRPLEKLHFRARFDLALEVMRGDGELALNEIPISIDHTPLRIRAKVGDSLYRSARAAGAPAKAVEAYIRTLRSRVPMSRLGAGDEFDLIVEQARAETGEVQLGKLLYAGIDQGRNEVQLVRWDQGGRTEWFDAKGMGERRGQFSRPVPGGVTSNYGFRMHPVLGYRRMHKGMDFHAAYGTPIRAASDGVISFAGRAGGYGNFVKVSHGGGLVTGYGHMSRIAVQSGTHVSSGQVIGYVGSTGLSTGPHLHYEVWRNGVSINPSSMSFTTQQQLGGHELGQFRTTLAHLLAVPTVGAAKRKEMIASR